MTTTGADMNPATLLQKPVEFTRFHKVINLNEFGNNHYNLELHNTKVVYLLLYLKLFNV